jgi:ArsR family transcriptional regulator
LCLSSQELFIQLFDNVNIGTNDGELAMDPQLVQELEMLHDRVCEALSDPKRIMILYLLAEAPLIVNDIASVLDLPQPTVSRHLKILRERSLVETTRQANTVSYALADRRIIQALDLMRGILRDRVMKQAKLVDNAS